MLDVLRHHEIGIMHPVIANTSAYIMSMGAMSKPLAVTARSHPTASMDPEVTAATALYEFSSTEVMDVNKISADRQPVYKHVGVADSQGHLHSVDHRIEFSSWLKIIDFAKDIDSYNVKLMTTGSGVVLRTTKLILPGESLAIWFEENILAMMNMPYLTAVNFKGGNYVCHVCDDMFEFPNPLKIHLALNCDRLDKNSLWVQLAKEFYTATMGTPLFPKPFRFECTAPIPRTSPLTIPSSPIKSEPTASAFNNSGGSSTLNSSSFSSQSSNSPPVSSYTIAPKSPRRSPRPYSSSSSSARSYASPPGKMVSSHHPRQSAFKPYSLTKPKAFSTSVLPPSDNLMIAPYHLHSPTHPAAAAVIENVRHPAEVESIASSIHKSTEGHLCVFCGKIYSRKYGLKIHIRTHTGYKPLQCKYCLRAFGDPSNLNKHVRLHADGETPYRCDLCGKVLVRRRDLERHIRSRHHDNAGNMSDASSDGMDQ